MIDPLTRPTTYGRLAYLLAGLPLGIAWVTILVTGYSVAIALIPVALLGVPLLLAMWHATRAFAHIERALAERLLGVNFRPVPSGAEHLDGSVWRQLTTTCRDRGARRELAFLLLRLPFGALATSVVTAVLTVPVALAYAPFYVRYVDDDSFGPWRDGDRLHAAIAGTPWSWGLVPLAAAVLIAGLTAVGRLARAHQRWATDWLTGR